MEKLVISRVDEPTLWCTGMVVVLKNNRSVCICVDLKALNTSIMREIHPIPCKSWWDFGPYEWSSLLDSYSGFWQIPLCVESRPLYIYSYLLNSIWNLMHELPFGISSVLELLQKRMNSLLVGLERVLCLVDDILGFGANRVEHNSRLDAVMDKLQDVNVPFEEPSS